MRRAVDLGITRLLDIYGRLSDRYGPRHWWPADGPFEVIVGAILTQQTTWANVEKALANLKAAGALSPAAMRALTEDELATLIRPSGFYRSKARKLHAFLTLLFDRFAGDLARLLATSGANLRSLLLATHGIGPETADAILVYAAHQPYFVIDAYTRRTFSRIGLRPPHDTYDAWQAFFHDSLPADPPLFNEYHALIVEHGQGVCRSEPLCGDCPLSEICETGLTRLSQCHTARDSGWAVRRLTGHTPAE
ncbi:MAG: hypothetical protein WED85_04800 [Dehalococcoidia bacterium]